MIYLQGLTCFIAMCRHSCDDVMNRTNGRPIDRSALWPQKICSSNRVAISKDWGLKNISNLHSSCLPLFQQGQQLELTFQSLAKFLRKTPNMRFKCNQLEARMRKREEGYTLTGLVDHTSDLQNCHLNCRKKTGFRFRCDPAGPTSHSPMAWTCRTPTNQWLEPADYQSTTQVFCSQKDKHMTNTIWNTTDSVFLQKTGQSHTRCDHDRNQ